MEYHHFNCQCSDFSHLFRFVRDPKDNELWIEAHLNHYLPWYKRIWLALKYVFKQDSNDTHYDVSLIRQEDIFKIKDMLFLAEPEPLTKEDCQHLVDIVNKKDINHVFIGAWICNLQGTDQWTVDYVFNNGMIGKIIGYRMNDYVAEINGKRMILKPIVEGR